jgi:hypothetical protein
MQFSSYNYRMRNYHGSSWNNWNNNLGLIVLIVIIAGAVFIIKLLGPIIVGLIIIICVGFWSYGKLDDGGQTIKYNKI